MAVAARIYEHGPPSVLTVESVKVGAPGSSEVRLRQTEIGLNFVDTMFRDGTFPLQLPAVLGIEGTGVVDIVGSGVTGFQPGDRVAYFYAPGSYASARLAPADALLRLPEDISEAQAATFLGKGLTAWMALRLLHRVESGETILVQGASGATGTIVLLWAKALGARVIAVVGSREKLGAAALNADAALWSGDPDFQSKVRALAPDGVDAVCEFVGKSTIAQSVASLRRGGVLLTIGAASGAADLDQSQLTERRIRVAGGSTVRNVSGDLIAQATNELFDAIRLGYFASVKAKRYQLQAVATAHADIAARRIGGPALLIAPRDPE